MKIGIIVLIVCWTLALVLHILKIVLTKKYNVEKKKYDENLINNDSNRVLGNYKKVYINMFSLYVKSLDQGKILCIILGVFALLREVLKQGNIW